MVHSTITRPAQSGAADLPAAGRHGYFSTLVETVFPLSETDLDERSQQRAELEGLSVQDLLAAYACMKLSREIDKMETLLHRSGNLWFSIAGAGKEALKRRGRDAPARRRHQVPLLPRPCAGPLVGHHDAGSAAPGHRVALRSHVGRAAND